MTTLDRELDDLDEAEWAAQADDPLVGRLEQLNAELLIPAQTLERLEKTLIGTYYETMSAQRRRRWHVDWRLPRAFAAATAALFLMASVALATTQTDAGEPLYGVRLAVEDMTLPAAGTRERLEAQLRLVSQRLAEATAAAQRGDASALADAANAYASRLDSAVRDALQQADTTPLARLITDQEAEIAELALRAPAPATAAVATAAAAAGEAKSKLAGEVIVPSDCAVPAIGAATSGAATPAASPQPRIGCPSPVPSPTVSATPASTPRPSATDTPEPSAMPRQPSPTPTSSPAPTVTPAPTATSTPAPTATSTPAPTDAPSASAAPPSPSPALTPAPNLSGSPSPPLDASPIASVSPSGSG